jgi:hypothetical protein
MRSVATKCDSEWGRSTVGHAFVVGGIVGIVILGFVVLGIVLQTALAGGASFVASIGALLCLIGFFIPWYWVTFSPPHGAMIVNGGIMKASTFTETGLAELSTSGGKLLLGTAAAGAALSVSSLLSGLVGAQPIAAISKFLHAGTHLVLSYALLAFVWLQLAFWNNGFRADFENQEGRTQSAANAAQYVNGHLGVGLVILTIGVIFTGASVFLDTLIWLGIVVLIIIGFAIFDSSALGSFFHWLDFGGSNFAGIS